MFTSLAADYSGDGSDSVADNQSSDHQIAGDCSSWEVDPYPRFVVLNPDFAIY